MILLAAAILSASAVAISNQAEFAVKNCSLAKLNTL